MIGLNSISESLWVFFLLIKNDVIFGLLLAVCLAISLTLNKYPSLNLGKKLDGLIGITLTICATKYMVLCSFIVVSIHLVLYQKVKDPVLLGNISFYGTFVYLAILRMIHFVGLPPMVHIANSMQLVMTLRVIGLTYEICDARSAENEHPSNDKPFKRLIKPPSTFEAFNYLYSFTGLFTGPYYTYLTYADAIEAAPYFSKEDLGDLVYEKISKLYWTVPLILFFGWLDPITLLKSEDIKNYSIIFLFVWSALAFMQFRMRIYSAWMVAESICIVSGIGVYPEASQPEPGTGPRILAEAFKHRSANSNKNIKYSAEAISNLDIPRIEHSDGFRSGMRAWNRSVQFWLANFVYKRSEKSRRLSYTMFVSAFWHGIKPGYFLSFLTIPLCTYAEDLVFKAFPINNRPVWLSILWSFIRMRGFESMACGFLLLTWTDTIRLWANMYFWLHFTMLGAIVLAKIKLNSTHPLENPKSETITKTAEALINQVSNESEKSVLKKEL